VVDRHGVDDSVPEGSAVKTLVQLLDYMEVAKYSRLFDRIPQHRLGCVLGQKALRHFDVTRSSSHNTRT